MKSARGVQGFIRYWGPENGGINEPSRAAYGALLRVFLDAKSLRWFFDTFLTAGNILILLGQYSPEVRKLHQEWYCYKLGGTVQGNSKFPIHIWMKKAEYWMHEDLC